MGLLTAQQNLGKMSKRKLEFCEYSKVEEEAVSADLHGVVTSLSPLKKSRSAGNQYFDGEACDATQTLQFIGFSPDQKNKLNDFLQSKAPVIFASLTVKVVLSERPTNLGYKRKQNVIVSDHTGSCYVHLQSLH